MEQTSNKKLDLIYQDNFGRFYQAGLSGKRPIVFIDGQMDPKIQYVINTLGINQKEGKNFYYDEHYHTPYIWVYDCDITGNDLGTTNETFAASVYRGMQEAKLNDIDVLGFSNGGTIALLCSNYDCVARVLSVHPSIQGSFLVNPKDLLERLDNPTLFTQVFLRGLDAFLTQNFGYMQENGELLKDFVKKIIKEKVFITNADITKTENSEIHFKFGKYLAMLGLEAYGLLSDGVVVVDEEYLKNNGIQYLMNNNYAHFNMNKENIAKDYQLLLTKK